MLAITWLLLAFMVGALPFSVWLGKLAVGQDIRQYGDHNPGATNTLRAAGWRWGGLALLLDISKGVIPVGLALHWLSIEGWLLALIALAPVLGHAYSPFLQFRGGKAIAATGGVWIGLTSGEALLYLMPLFIIWYVLIADDGWTVVLTMTSFLGCLLFFGPLGVIVFVWLGTMLILTWKHRRELTTLPQFRSWIKNAWQL